MLDLPVGGLEALVGPLFHALGLRHGAGDSVQLFTLALARWLPLLSLCPFLGGRLVPMPVRMGLALVLALFVLPGLSATAPVPLVYTDAAWFALLLKEAFIGVALGVGSGLVFWGADMAGRFIDNVRGTTTANILIPQLQVQTSLLGDFYFQLFIVLFMVAGGGRYFLATIFESYQVLPAIEPRISLATIAPSFIAATGHCWVIALKLMAPPLVVLILLDVILGVAGRMAPQLDVFFISMSIKASLGALVVGLSLWYLLAMAPDMFRDQQHWLSDEIHRLAPVPVGASPPSGAAAASAPASTTEPPSPLAAEPH